MNDNNLDRVAPETAEQNDNHESALVGKIARLPDNIREELNQRLLDGHSGTDILPWLNELPEVKSVLAAHFNGQSINKQNLHNWRQLGYRRWRQTQNLGSAKKLGKYAAAFTEAAGGQFGPAAAAVASGKIFEFLDTADPEQIDPDKIVRCATAASALLKGEQNFARLKIANARLLQRDLQLLLQRDTTVTALRVLNDDRAKEINASSMSYDEKIEVLGIHLYDDMWEPRPVPAFTQSEQASSSPSGQGAVKACQALSSPVKQP